MNKTRKDGAWLIKEAQTVKIREDKGKGETLLKDTIVIITDAIGEPKDFSDVNLTNIVAIIPGNDETALAISRLIMRAKNMNIALRKSLSLIREGKRDEAIENRIEELLDKEINW